MEMPGSVKGLYQKLRSHFMEQHKRKEFKREICQFHFLEKEVWVDVDRWIFEKWLAQPTGISILDYALQMKDEKEKKELENLPLLEILHKISTSLPGDPVSGRMAFRLKDALPRTTDPEEDILKTLAKSFASYCAETLKKDDVTKEGLLEIFEKISQHQENEIRQLSVNQMPSLVRIFPNDWERLMQTLSVFCTDNDKAIRRHILTVFPNFLRNSPPPKRSDVLFELQEKLRADDSSMVDEFPDVVCGIIMEMISMIPDRTITRLIEPFTRMSSIIRADEYVALVMGIFDRLRYLENIVPSKYYPHCFIDSMSSKFIKNRRDSLMNGGASEKQKLLEVIQKIIQQKTMQGKQFLDSFKETIDILSKNKKTTVRKQVSTCLKELVENLEMDQSGIDWAISLQQQITLGIRVDEAELEALL